jgi:serine/threonine protein phosphatase PrpC
MHKNNRISNTIERPNERIISSYQNYSRRTAVIDSSYTLRKTNMNIANKEIKINTNNKYLICNTSPNVKISKHLNLTRTIQNIPRSSHSKEVYSNNKLLNKNNVLSGVRTNTNYSINYNNSVNSSRTNKSTNRSQTINFSLTENAKKAKYQKITINNNPKNNFYANLNNVRISHKSFGIIQAYSTITTKGKRDYNEDRVSIIYNIPKPPGYSESKNNNIPWPNCSFFGLYDGHGGNRACDFLRDNLHKYIINDKYFPSNPQKAIANGFINAEKLFFKNYKGIDSSGSCAIVIVVIEKRVYIANVGDSRAILSSKNGSKFYALSRDHRPGDEKEYKRILDAGGKIYKTEYEYQSKPLYNNNRNSNNNRSTRNSNNSINSFNNRISCNKPSSIIGPLRVIPGKLSVSRTIGDIEAKDPKFGGNPNVIISIPEIKYFDNADKNDFILIFCDGVYEKLKNKDINDCIWDEIKKKKFGDIHNMAGYCVEKLINKCIAEDSTDNLTAIMICLKSYENMKHIESSIPQTENIEQIKNKKLNILANIKKRSQSKKPLSMLLTKLIHNNSQNVRKVINIKNSRDIKESKDKYRRNEK